MKTKFQYSRTYTFESPAGKRRHWAFNLVERFGEGASFRLTDKKNDDVIPTAIEMDGEVETVRFFYYGKEYTLRADRYQPKDYRQTIDGRLEKKDDALADTHLHTADNREEVEASQFCYCINCQTFLKPAEIGDYTDGGVTAICPYCECDAILGEACGIKLTDELLGQLHQRYFSYDDIEDTGMEIYIATDLLFAEGAYRFNAIYAFKSETSLKSYEKYLRSIGENHKLVVTPTTVTDLEQSLQVVTEFEINDDLPEYKSTIIFDDYDTARDYVENIKDTQPSVRVEHDVVKILARFSPKILNSGWA